MQTSDAYERIFGNKQTIMVITAHPDDLDVLCGGTVARLVADGKRVVAVKLTAGDRGSRDLDVAGSELAQTRLSEDAAAMKVLGLASEDCVNLGMADGEVENSLTTIEQLSLWMRRFQPDILITTNPEHLILRHSDGSRMINHRDHRQAAMSAIDAMYPYSRDRASFPQQFEDDPSLQPAHCSEVLIADAWEGLDEAVVDVTSYMDQKHKSLASHASQMTPAQAAAICESFTHHPGLEGSFEKFRHVVID